MFSPLNVGSSIDWPSLKSFSQPTFGQTSGVFSGTPQNFVYMMSWVTFWRLTLKPELLELALDHLRGVGAGGRVVADHRDLAVRALALAARRTRPSSCTRPRGPGRRPGWRGSRGPGPSRPPASSKPGKSGGGEVRGHRADELAAAGVAQVGAVRVGDHGLADVDVVERRLRSCSAPRSGCRRSASASAGPRSPDVAACLITLGGVVKSPLTMAIPRGSSCRPRPCRRSPPGS